MTHKYLLAMALAFNAALCRAGGDAEMRAQFMDIAQEFYDSQKAAYERVRGCRLRCPGDAEFFKETIEQCVANCGHSTKAHEQAALSRFLEKSRRLHQSRLDDAFAP